MICKLCLNKAVKNIKISPKIILIGYISCLLYITNEKAYFLPDLGVMFHFQIRAIKC